MCCLEGEEGKAALGEGRKAGRALFEVRKAEVFSKTLLDWDLLQQGQSLHLCPRVCWWYIPLPPME